MTEHQLIGRDHPRFDLGEHRGTVGIRIERHLQHQSNKTCLRSFGHHECNASFRKA